MKMRKLVAVVMAMLMLCCVIPFVAATADEAAATIDFTDKANWDGPEDVISCEYNKLGTRWNRTKTG